MRKHELNGLQCPASAIEALTHFPAMQAAMHAVDVGLLIDARKYLLGFVGVSADGLASGFVASPRFATLDQIECFCAEHGAEYVAAGELEQRQGTCLSPAQWGELLRIEPSAFSCVGSGQEP